MASRGHLIASHRLEVLAGLGALVVGALLLHDAYDRRGQPQPRWLRPFSFW